MRELLTLLVVAAFVLGGLVFVVFVFHARRQFDRTIRTHGRWHLVAPKGDEDAFFTKPTETPALAPAPQLVQRRADYDVPMELDFGDAAAIPPPPFEFDGVNRAG